MVLILPLFVNNVFATTNPVFKNEITEVQYPREDKTVKITDIRKTRFLPILYVVTLEVCAGKEKLYSPWLELKSDIDTIRVKVTGLIMSNSCKTAEFFILAKNPDSITVSFITLSHSDYPKVTNTLSHL